MFVLFFFCLQVVRQRSSVTALCLSFALFYPCECSMEKTVKILGLSVCIVSLFLVGCTRRTSKWSHGQIAFWRSICCFLRVRLKKIKKLIKAVKFQDYHASLLFHFYLCDFHALKLTKWNPVQRTKTPHKKIKACLQDYRTYISCY